MLPIPVTIAASAVAIALVVGAGSGFYAGSEWQLGRAAQEKAATLTQTLTDANTAIERLQKQTEDELKNRKTLTAIVIPNTETVIRETLQPIYTDCRITANSVRALNSTVDETNAAIERAGILSTGN